MTPEKFMARFNVDVRVESEVVSIDRGAMTVTVRDLSDGREYRESYDRLILSPGAAPIVPPLPGASDGRVFTLRNIPDTLKIKAYMEDIRPPAVLSRRLYWR
jgi:NADPH-dependent 2,4-dienoyl-CoA reductase/sulfur reductase-like enzyme